MRSVNYSNVDRSSRSGVTCRRKWGLRMFVGHYGIALAAKSIFPDAPLPALMFATQAIDIVFASLVIARIEKVEIDKNATATVGLRLPYMPYSHGLLGSLIISILSALLTLIFYPEMSGAILTIIGCVAFSHWFLDLIVHDKDLPLIANRNFVGMGLWNHKWPAIALEFAIILLGVAMLYHMNILEGWKVLSVGAGLCALQAYNFFGPNPGTINTLAFSMLGIFLAMVGVGYWMEL